jgi:hypothetical protein
MSEGESGGSSSVDVSKGIEIEGQTFYPLSRPSELNPCAGKNDGTSCGSGCVCRGGQCYYSLRRLQEMGVKVPNV